MRVFLDTQGVSKYPILDRNFSIYASKDFNDDTNYKNDLHRTILIVVDRRYYIIYLSAVGLRIEKGKNEKDKYNVISANKNSIRNLFRRLLVIFF